MEYNQGTHDSRKAEFAAINEVVRTCCKLSNYGVDIIKTINTALLISFIHLLIVGRFISLFAQR